MVVQHAHLKLEELEASLCAPCARMVSIYYAMILTQHNIQQSIRFAYQTAELFINPSQMLIAENANVFPIYL